METTVIEREAAVLIGTRVAAERLAWDADTIRRFQEKRAAEAERRRQAKLPVTVRTAHREMSVMA